MRQPWWHADRSTVSVSGGVVHFTGQVNSLDEKAPARVAAENIPGVRAVEDGRLEVFPSAIYAAGGYL
ncbi:MAG: BON domain-containing protein [Betaproteobacteria bacterium]